MALMRPQNPRLAWPSGMLGAVDARVSVMSLPALVKRLSFMCGSGLTGSRAKP